MKFNHLENSSKSNVLRFSFLKNEKMPDYLILGIYICFCCFSIILMYSSSYNFSEKTFKDPYYLFHRHLIGMIISICFLFLGYILSFEWLRKYSAVISLLLLVLLILPFLPWMNQTIAGTNRWVSIGTLQFQPSEIAKMLIVFYLAHQLTKKTPLTLITINKETSAPFLLSSFCALLILIQKDFSTSVVFMATIIMIFYIRGLSSKHIFYLLLLALLFFIPFVLFTPYRLNRIEMFFDLHSNPSNAYQIIKSMTAFNKGGLFGLGPGEESESIPYIFNDFIFAAIGKEFGLMGCLLIIILFFLLLKRGLKLSSHLANKADYYGSIITFGFTLNIVFQAFLNIAVNLALIFPTGIPLPLLSYGRTSFIISSFCIGVILKYSAKYE